MFYSRISWAMDYWLIFFIIFLLSYHHFSSYLFVYILCSIICLCHHISFYAMSDNISYFSAWKTVMSPSTPISWTLVWRSLIEKVILSERVCTHHCLRVCQFHYVFLVKFICLIFRVCEKKNEKGGNERMYLCMYTMSFSIECAYWPLRAVFF